MYYYKFRYTLTDDLQDGSGNWTSQQKSYLNIMYDFIEKYSIGKISSGLECRNKCGEIVKKHIHIHFQSDKVKDTIQSAFRKLLNEDGDTRKKSQVYCLKAEADIDEHKFFRYPLKERLDGVNNKYHKVKEIPLDEYNDLNKVAYEQRKIVYEINQTKTSKKEDVGFVGRLHIELDKHDIYTHKEIFCEIVRFYIQDDKPCNKKQISDHAYLYMLKKEIITPEEFYLI